MSQISIQQENPHNEDVTILLQTHLSFCYECTPPENVYALDIDALCKPNILVYVGRINEEVISVCALRLINEYHGELKSMHTLKQARGKGIGKAMLDYVINIAKNKGLNRLSLETGTTKEFVSARNLYYSIGFKDCEPFENYEESIYSICMTMELK